MIPYFSAAKIIVLLIRGEMGFSAYIPWLTASLVGFLACSLLYNSALGVSHKATLRILKTIREKLLEKLPHLPLGTAVTLSYSGPIFIALATIGLYLKIGKRVPWLLVFSVLLGFIGICVMMHPTVSSDTLTLALTALVTGVLAPFIFMTVQKLGSLGEPSARIVFYFMLVSTLWGLAGGFVVEGGFHSHGTLLWVMLLGVRI